MITCPACNKEYTEIIDTCSVCAFPFDGTEKERSIHIGKFISTKGVLIDSDTTIKKIQHLFYFIGGFNLMLFVMHSLMGIVFIVNSILDFLFFIVFMICGIFIRKNPLVFTIIPLLFMIGMNTLYYLIDPELVLNGIIYKIIIVGCLLYSIYVVLKAQDFKRKYNVD